MSAIEDGIYEVIVVEADELVDGAIALSLAIASGSHRGDVVQLRATHLDRGWIELLAAPGTLTVINGEPSFRPD